MSARYKGLIGDVGPKAIYRARALSFLGLSPTDPLVFDFFEDFEKTTTPGTAAPPGWSMSNAVTGGQSHLTAVKGGGWRRLSSGATAASTAELTTFGTTILNVSTVRWYAACRFQFSTTPDAVSVLLNTILNQASTKSIGMGYRGSLNASNFIVQYDGLYVGSSIDLGVPKDTAAHVIEIYALASTSLKARIDGGATEFSATMAAAPADPILGFDLLVQNGVTAANQSEDVDWVYMLGQRS